MRYKVKEDIKGFIIVQFTNLKFDVAETPNLIPLKVENSYE